MSRWIETDGRKPRSGEHLLKVKFANGMESAHACTADQLRWDRRGSEFDIVAARRA